MELNNKIIESLHSKIMLSIISNTYNIYMKYGARSSKKVNYFHEKIKNILKEIFNTNKEIDIILEYNIKSLNATGKKKM